MRFREATVADIPEMSITRNAVKENVLSNPALITVDDYMTFMTVRGKGWICEISGRIVGFSIVDLVENNIWALFVHPDYDRKGIGRKLHDIMLDWYFGQEKATVWLGTAPKTRADEFYQRSGWKVKGMYGNEKKFEMTKVDWEHNRTLKK